MTLVNRLIKEARAEPEFLYIEPHHVRRIAAHAHSLMHVTDKPTIEFLESEIRGGRMTMCGIPLRVREAA